MSIPFVGQIFRPAVREGPRFSGGSQKSVGDTTGAPTPFETVVGTPFDRRCGGASERSTRTKPLLRETARRFSRKAVLAYAASEGRGILGDRTMGPALETPTGGV